MRAISNSMNTSHYVDSASRRLCRPGPWVCFLSPSYWYALFLCILSSFRLYTDTLSSSTASGLYYLSEVVEEHTVIAKKLLTRMIYAVIVTQSLLWLFDGFPAILSITSMGSHMIYMQNLRRFPIVKLTDPVFLLSCGRARSHRQSGILSSDCSPVLYAPCSEFLVL